MAWTGPRAYNTKASTSVISVWSVIKAKTIVTLELDNFISIHR